MPPPLNPAGALTSWTIDWPTLVVCLALAAAYVVAVRRVGWPLGRVVSFLAGLALVAWSTCSFLGVYDGVLFWTRAVQNIVLFMGAPLLLALGAPFGLLRAASSARTRARLRRLGHSRPAAVATMPVVVTVALLLPLPLLYFSPLYEATLDHASIDTLVRLALVLCGFVYYWTRLQVDPTPREATHLVSFAISFAEMLVDGALGVVVWLGPLIASDHYQRFVRDWGPSMRRDQTMGAVALWFGGDIIGIPYLVALFVQWFRDEGRAASRVDAELDRADDGHDTGLQDGLWWETDARLADRPGFGRHDTWPPTQEDPPTTGVDGSS